MTVYYKLKGGFNFKVGAGLTIKNVKFDGIDSLIDIWSDISNGSGCSPSGSGLCCSLDTSTQTIKGTPVCYMIRTP